MTNPILASQRLVIDGAAPPSKWMFVLHGIFGMGTNFRGLMKSLGARVPGWGFVLVDLRGHGNSQGFPAPHTLASAAADIEALSAALGVEVDGIAGHSFGGKVALAYMARRTRPLDVALILDSMPGARPTPGDGESAPNVLAVLESIEQPLASREAFRETLQARGFSPAIVDWLAMNVRPEDGRYRLRLDLPAIRAMLADYFATDLWPVLERESAAARTCLVIAGKSSVFDADARARAQLAAERNPRLVVRTLAGAGHWLHVDDPAGLLDLLVAAIKPGASVG